MCTLSTVYVDLFTFWESIPAGMTSCWVVGRACVVSGSVAASTDKLGRVNHRIVEGNHGVGATYHVISMFRVEHVPSL